MIRVRSSAEIAFRETRARVGQGVVFQRQTFLEPRLQLGMLWVEGVAKDANRSASIDFLEALKDRTKKRFVLHWVAHVVDCEDNHRFYIGLSNPLRRSKSWEFQTDIKGVCFV